VPRLHIVEGFGAGLVIELGSSPVNIGRDAACQVQIADPKASRVHAEITLQDGALHLQDLGSSNGTWNDRGRIDGVALTPGSRFRIGSTYFRVEGDGAVLGGNTLVGDDGDWQEPEGLESLDPADLRLLRRSEGDEDPAALRQANDFLVLLHELVLRAHACRSRDELFEMLDDIAADALEGDRCAVFLPTGSGWALWPPHERRLRARFGSTPYTMSLLAAMSLRREPLLMREGGDMAPSTSMIQARVSAAMVAPLRIGEELHACIYVDRLEKPAPFTRTELEFLAAAANQLAVRLVNRDQIAALEAELDLLQAETAPRISVDLVGDDASMRQVQAFIGKAAPTSSPVLITGESGTGKELVARAIYAASRRADQALQVVNCAAISEHLVESTLFGHVKGSFTGADRDHPGIFELADRGTLFLDEIGELPLPAQAKLLRVLENGEVQRVGEGLLRHVDVRIIAATNRDLHDEVAAGRFREDLLHRLDVLQVEIPPLRLRPGDLEPLIDHFLATAARKLEIPRRRLTPATRTLLLRYGWPGNVRQLRNTLERASLLCSGRDITPEDLPEQLRDAPSSLAAPTSGLLPLAEVERQHILHILEHTGGNKKATAEMLGIDRSTLYAKLRQYGQH